VSKCQNLRPIVEDLIRATHLLAKELERLSERVEQSVGHLGYTPQFSVVASETTELLLRAKSLAQTAESDAA
jgi:hypothetical protein